MFVELERKDMESAVPVQQIQFPTPYPVISTRPSDIKKFFDAVTEVLVTFNKLDTRGISDRIQSALTKIERTVDDAQIQTLVSELHATLSEIRAIATEKKWEDLFESLDRAAIKVQSFANAGIRAAGGFNATLDHIDVAVAENEKVLKTLLGDVHASILHIDSLVAGGNRFLESTHKDTARLLPQLQNALRHYEKAGRHLERFLERIAEQPSQLILGSPAEDPLVSPERH